MTWFSLSWEFLKTEIHLHIHFISQLNHWLRELIACRKNNWEDLTLKIWRRVGPSFHYSRGSPGQISLIEQKHCFFELKFMFLTSFCVFVLKNNFKFVIFIRFVNFVNNATFALSSKFVHFNLFLKLFFQKTVIWEPQAWFSNFKVPNCLTFYWQFD